MKPRSILLLLLSAALLVGAGFAQKSLNLDRQRLELTRTEPLQNAPPVLAFTTVALGGFRGLISNALWMRASDLQDEDKFFEMAQLADWITKLEPHFVQVWLVQAWNMAYNISVKFKDFPDRWRWVKRGIELLRDDGLRFNPNELLIYRELAWFFQHKMGQDLDDAARYYRQQWANEMAVVFDKKTPNLDELIHPQTASQSNRAQILIEKYKMDPKFMKEVNDRYGPLDWRLPESHAIYWAALGLKHADENPTRVKADDLITLHRVVYQSMQLSFQRGRMVINPFAGEFELSPNLDLIPKVSAAYEQAAEEDASNRDHILRAHRNFLRDAVYFLYEHNRLSDAERWYKYLGEKYPDKPILDGKPDSFPRKVPIDEYVMSRMGEDINETDPKRVRTAIEGLLINSYTSMVLHEDERAAGLRLLAQKIWSTYQSKISPDRMVTIGLPPFADIDKDVVNRLLDPKGRFPPEARRVLREILGKGPEPAAETDAPSPNLPSTNAPPGKASSG